MKKVIEESAWDGFFTIAGDKKLGKKLKRLLDDIDRQPFSGIGKFEMERY